MMEQQAAGAENEKYLKLLKSADFFSPFDDVQLAELAKYGKIRKYPMHEYIIREGSSDFSFYVILQGTVGVGRQDAAKKRRVALATLQAGDCFGEMAFAMNSRRSADVICSVECYLFVIDAQELEKLPPALQNKLLKRMMYYIAKKLRRLNDSVLHMY